MIGIGTILFLVGFASAIYFVYIRMKKWYHTNKISVLQIILMIFAVSVIIILLTLMFFIITQNGSANSGIFS
jgi:maltodextrin utilization protein YvdJ